MAPPSNTMLVVGVIAVAAAATRHARRVYIGGLSPTSNEQISREAWIKSGDAKEVIFHEVEYIFTNKTGTLTRNLMEFFKCSIGGEVYGTGITKIEKGGAQRNKENIYEAPKLFIDLHEKGFNFDDARLMRGSWRNEHNADSCKPYTNYDKGSRVTCEENGTRKR